MDLITKHLMQHTLNIQAVAKQVMIDDALTTFPNECCGFFYGSEENGERLLTLAQAVINNKAGDQRRRFEISPLVYMKAERYALTNNLTLLGVYHSHPNHPAIPSIHDLKQAMPYFSYVIISIMQGEFNVLRSWRLKEEEGAFEEEKVNYTMAPK